MDNSRLQYLLTQYFDNTITRADCMELLRYLDHADPKVVQPFIDAALKAKRPEATFASVQQKRTYGQILSNIKQLQGEPDPEMESTANRPIWNKRWLQIAAGLLIVFSVAAVIYRTSLRTQQQPNHSASDILLPDGQRAILTLADGRSIVVDDASDTLLAEEMGVKITKDADGSVLYTALSIPLTQGETAFKKNQFNTFSTPKGHSHRLVLPDGTGVWLNTSSSIRFPPVFTGSKRTVELTGEAYFEVAHDETRPFEVHAEGSTVRVLGTHFNVSAYVDDRQVTTTLIEGKVNVSKNGKEVTLQPGQRAVVDGITGAISQSQADTRAALAWRNGYFRFDNEPIEDIMKKISKWYDIEAIEYQGQFIDRFTGTFQRSKGASQLFNHLEKLAPIRFKIKERRVIVMK